MPMTQPKTIEVGGFFGPKQITREDFVKQWTDHVNQLHRLSFDHFDEFCKIAGRVSEIAGQEWDRLYKAQHEEAENVG